MSRILNAGANGGGPSEGVFFKHWNARRDLNSQKMALAAKLKKAKKAAEDDGVDWGDLDAIGKIHNAGSTAALEFAKKQNARKLFLSYLKNPTADLMQFIDESTIASDEAFLSDEERQAKWRGIGEVAGKEGKSLDVVLEGHDPNSDTGRFIREGWEAGQAELAKGIKKKKADQTEDKPAKPVDEPEVIDVKARKKKSTGGVSYWHNPETKKLYEVTVSDATPEGAVAITRAEYNKLKDEYAAAESDDWESSAPSSNDGFDSPPSAE